MKLNKGKYRKYLSQSILLEERGAPEILRAVLFFIVILLLLFLYWASKVELKEQISAHGEVVPGQGHVDLQISRSGVLKEIHVENNQLVHQGQVVLSLDSRRIALELQQEEISKALEESRLRSYQREWATLYPLYEENLVSQQEFQRLESSIVQSRGNLSIIESRIQTLQLDLQGSELIAAMTGRIHGLGNLHEGTVLRSGELICQILPEEGLFQAEVSIEPSQRGRIEEGQSVELRFPSYPYGRFGGMDARLDSISSSTYIGPDGKSYYRGYISIPQRFLEQQGQHFELVLGMPVSAEIVTGSKTLLSYMVFPVKASFRNAFREE